MRTLVGFGVVKSTFGNLAEGDGLCSQLLRHLHSSAGIRAALLHQLQRATEPNTKDQVARDKQAIIAALRQTILDPEASVLDKTRAADTLGRLSDYSLFTKPSNPTVTDTGITEATAKRIASLAERLSVSCPHCGGTL